MSSPTPISLTRYRNKSVALLGLGASGRASASALERGGAEVFAWDDMPEARDKASAEGYKLIDLSQDEPMRDCACLVVAPGVPLSHRAVRCARFWNKPVIGDVELLWEAYPKARITGVTGTNGKSTTTALLAHLYRACGREVQVGGNLGLPVLSFEAMENEGEGAELIIELSSFQLDLIDRAHFATGVLLNIAHDHLDRYETLWHYIGAKMRIARNAQREDLLVCGIDDEHAQRTFLSLQKAGQKAGFRVVPVSGFHSCPEGVWVQGERLYDARAGKVQEYAVPFCAHLQGIHNGQNIAAAYTAVSAMGLASDTISASLFDSLARFEGLEHRTRETARVAGVRYIDDSKATNPHAAMHALASYADSAVFWLGGGRVKGELRPLFEELRAFLNEHANKPSLVCAGYFFGESGEAMREYFQACFPSHAFADMEQAFAAATEQAREQSDQGLDSVVLLSPACSSFDQFANYVERGEHFEHLVARLQPTTGAAS